MSKTYRASVVTSILLLVSVMAMLFICIKIIHVRKVVEFNNEQSTHCVSREVYDTYMDTVNHGI